MQRISEYGHDIISTHNYQRQKHFLQHGRVSVYEHELNVTNMCLKIADYLPVRVNERALVRGALLHDYFLYDWHEPGHGLHGFKHPHIALENASEDYYLTDIEKDMIRKHMFPLTLKLPRYKESYILVVADKIVAISETLHRK
ncbi:uncharacterized protein SAMN04487759_10450 [Kandleria vitulina]|jgi:uncharacterized protein|uniref:HD domain-containing protein n=2 Tax=Kandleria vitulina TaxID=1630 RepID=A0A0R2HEL8_9FIRM|nr:HD domain-containing protein [Kandleria vitulina]KRN51474.1 hypothetical protein IV49_GL000091 [Kandleria vitulina DSM 20405]MEE0988291.1 HD domain-containing protein [Kandleria vitulina]SDL26292.1 uncharacterized protein SAMN05216520_10335 [Kandleria vitulina]SDW12117.1 uncharacterized protein SAMN04487759_10450 [Kandleria vitulina]SEJ09183.1 uncharacterized protein SAMN05216514_11039 [Kandleria vitulina]